MLSTNLSRGFDEFLFGIPLAGDALSTWATLVLMVPFGILLTIAAFGLDIWLAAPKGGRTVRIRFCEGSGDGPAAPAEPEGDV